MWISCKKRCSKSYMTCCTVLRWNFWTESELCKYRNYYPIRKRMPFFFDWMLNFTSFDGKTVYYDSFFVFCVRIRHENAVFSRFRIEMKFVWTLSVPFCLVFYQLLGSWWTSLECIDFPNFTSSFIFLHFEFYELYKGVRVLVVVGASDNQTINETAIIIVKISFFIMINNLLFLTKLVIYAFLTLRFLRKIFKVRIFGWKE